MSDTESTQLWNDEDDEVQSGQDFSDALASLEDHLQEYQPDDSVSYGDETDVDAQLYEEGVNYEPTINEDGEPAEVSLTDFTEEDALPDHGSQPEEDAGLSLDDELEAAFVEEEAPIDNDLDAALAAEDDSYANDFVSEDAADDDGFLSEAEPVEAEEFAAYPAYEETEEEMDSYSSPVAEAPVESPMAAMIGGHDGADDFNLATLTELVDEIRQESDRVSEMKESVARALSLIQEMSESLKS